MRVFLHRFQHKIDLLTKCVSCDIVISLQHGDGSVSEQKSIQFQIGKIGLSKITSRVLYMLEQ